MKKSLLTLLLIVVNLFNNIESMEQPETISKSESWMSELPSELRKQISALVGFNNATSFEQIYNKLQFLEAIEGFGPIVNDEVFIADLARRYIKKNKRKAEQEFVKAVENNKIPIVQAFIDGGIDVDSYAVNIPPLILASKFNNKKIVEMLLNAKAGVNLEDHAGNTALSWAALKGNKEIFEILIKAGADVNNRNNNGSTPLINAVIAGNKEIVKELLDKGVDINAQGSQGRTALMSTIIHDREEIARMLLDAGIDFNIQDESGSSALRYAKIFKNKAITEMLEALGAK